MIFGALVFLDHESDVPEEGDGAHLSEEENFLVYSLNDQLFVHYLVRAIALDHLQDTLCKSLAILACKLNKSVVNFPEHFVYIATLEF